ncbi:hypothetical protein ACMXYX_17965 (plasmid) [Neptuniibacter sp. QD72_48]|uniref:hypothetical protein n=1 Tax=Neptuniibacter sp. QD72_48 TaxID=3398214 RepID=UPI0039F5642C
MNTDVQPVSLEKKPTLTRKQKVVNALKAFLEGTVKTFNFVAFMVGTIYIMHHTTSIVGYNYKVAEFNNQSLFFSDYTWTFRNGRAHTDVADWNLNELRGKDIPEEGIPVGQICSAFTPVSQYGPYLSLVEGSEHNYCCGGKPEAFTPYKDVDGYRHYLCGEFPMTAEFKRPLEEAIQASRIR